MLAGLMIEESIPADPLVLLKSSNWLISSFAIVPFLSQAVYLLELMFFCEHETKRLDWMKFEQTISFKFEIETEKTTKRSSL